MYFLHIAQCFAGQFSQSGFNLPANLEPCEPCPKSSYQANLGQTSCEQCPNGTSTITTGSTSVNDCGGEQNTQRYCNHFLYFSASKVNALLFFWPSCLSLFSKLLPSKRSFVFLDFTYLTFDVFLLLLLFFFFFFFLCCCCFFLFVCLLLGPPVVTVFEPNPTNATENQATQFECYGTGLPLPTFSIKKLVPPPGIKRYATL